LLFLTIESQDKTSIEFFSFVVKAHPLYSLSQLALSSSPPPLSAAASSPPPPPSAPRDSPSPPPPPPSSSSSSSPPPLSPSGSLGGAGLGFSISREH
jgi:hypothetical protein